MVEETFRLPKSSYDELVKIVQAYGNSGEAAALDEVAQSVAMDKTIISRNNAFLSSVGIIQGGKAKGITEKGKALSHALQFNVPDDIAAHWRDIVNSNEFLQKMVTAVSIRGGMEDSALKSHIAYSAGEAKSTFVMAGAGAIVEILKVARLVKEVDGKLVAETSTFPGGPSMSARGSAKDSEKQDSPPAGKINSVAALQLPTSGVSIQIQIQCTAAEISGLAPKLRALLKELSREEDTKADDLH
jgi:hypothetical protein